MNRTDFKNKWGHTKGPLQKEMDKLLDLKHNNKINDNQKIKLELLNIEKAKDLIRLYKEPIVINSLLKSIAKMKKNISEIQYKIKQRSLTKKRIIKKRINIKRK